MLINADKPDRWKSDIAQSVDFYNNWFMQFAPKAFRETRAETIAQVEGAMEQTVHLTSIEPSVLRQHPAVLPMLRMATAPPIARDRLIGLAGVSPNLVKNMEIGHRIPPRMPAASVDAELEKISQVIMQMADRDIFTWLESGSGPNDAEVRRAATIVADRLCGAVTGYGSIA